MTVMTLVALDAPGDWKAWGLDYYDHTDLMGEIGEPRAGNYYGPPREFEDAPEIRVVDVETGFFVAELDHAALVRFWDPSTRLQAAPGDRLPAQAVGKRLDELPVNRLYAVTWLEVY
jgi:hypothetical protein